MTISSLCRNEVDREGAAATATTTEKLIEISVSHAFLHTHPASIALDAILCVRFLCLSILRIYLPSKNR